MSLLEGVGRVKLVAGLTKTCHPERSIAIGVIDRNAQSRDLLFAGAIDGSDEVHRSFGPQTTRASG